MLDRLFVNSAPTQVGAVILPFPSMARVKSPPVDDLPNRIREWRLRRDLTLKELAAASRLQYAHLSKIELGQRELNQETMARIAAGLGVAPADLLRIEAGGLTDEERRLIQTFREIPAAGRAAINAVAESQQAYRGEPEVVDLADRRSA